MKRTTVKYTFRLTLLLGGWIGLWMAASADAQMIARVKTDRVNLRAKPDMIAETVGQVSAGTKLTVRSAEGDWVQIVPPDTIDFWVHRDFLDQDTVLVTKLNARSGAGINYNVVGSFPKGDKVVRRGVFGEWVKVAAPADASVWVSADLVELINPAMQVPPPVAAPQTKTPTPSVAVVTTPRPVETPTPIVAQPTDVSEASGRAPARSSPSAPTDLKLLPLDGQGRLVQREGELKRAPVLMSKTPGTHRLIKRDGNKLITTAYVRGNRQQLEKLLNRSLVVQGWEYFVEEVPHPVIVIDSIETRHY